MKEPSYSIGFIVSIEGFEFNKLAATGRMVKLNKSDKNLIETRAK